MASGTIKGSFTNLSASHLYPEIRWRSTKNDTNNNSSVTAELWFVRVNTAYISNNAYFLPRITINGNAAYPPDGTYAPFDMRKGTHKVWQRTVTVAHNADGNKSITIEAGGITGLSNLGNVSVSGTAKLDTIPRASNIGTISGNQIGSAITIPISRASGSFTHDVSLKLGTKTVSATGVGTSATLTPNLADFCGQLTSSTSGTAVITVVTKSGSTTIGTKTKNHTIYVPASVVPNAKTLGIAERVASVSSLGLTKTFVQNKSTIGLTASADGIYGSTITDYTFTFNGRSQGGTVGRDFAVGTASAGNHTVTVTVTDSRGRKASRSDTVSILAYSMPNITKFDVARDGATLKVKANITVSVHNIASKGGSWKVQRADGNTWVNVDSGAITTSYTITGKTLTGDYDVTKSFNFRLVVSDAFGEGAILIRSVSTAQTLLDLNKNDGIGIGKMHERGTLDVGGDIYMEKGMSITNGAGFYNGILPAGNMSLGSYWHQTTFPKGISHWHKNIDDPLTGLPGGVNGWGMMQVMKNQNGAGEFTVIYYTQSNGRIFRTGGNSQSGDIIWYEVFSGASPELDISTIRSSSITSRGNIWAEGNISTGSNMFIKGKTVHADWTPPELWTGATYMDKDHTVTPSKPLASCRNGWMLIWSDYTKGVANDYDWVFTPIPKSAISAGVNGMHAMVANSNAPNAPMLSKYIYIGTGTKIVGQANNVLAGLDNVVLRKVYEF